MNQDKVIVVSTGGLYSTILLAKVVEEKGAENVTSIYFEGDLINNANAVSNIERLLNVKGKVIGLEQSLYTSTNTPFRNGVYAAMAANIAMSIGAGIVYMATWNNEEYLYPDATMEFSLPMSEATVAGTGGKVSLVFPFHRNSSEELILMAKRMQIPIEHSYSCNYTRPYEDTNTHCGKCEGCLKRIKAFKEAGVIDPASYKIDINWQNCQQFYGD